MLATEKLNGDNFGQWQRSAEISLIAKNKLGFVKGTCAKPHDNSPDLKQWERCNNLVISWLLHSVEPAIANSVLYCRTASEIWNELAERFGQSNAPRLYQLQKDLVSLEQGDKSVSMYFTQLKTLWDEYLTMVNMPVCTCGAGNVFVQFIQNQQVLQFLMGLNNNFKTAHGNILMMSPLPNLSHAYRLILQEEMQRDCTSGNVLSHESVAFVTQHQKAFNQTFNNQKLKGGPYKNNGISFGNNGQNVVFGVSPSGKKSKFFCEHCKIWGHSIDRCFKIPGQPGNSKQFFRGKTIAGIAQVDSDVQHDSCHNHHHGDVGHFDSSMIQVPMISQQQYHELLQLLNHSKLDNNSTVKSETVNPSIGSPAFMKGPPQEAFSGAW